jgi:Arc/MetJ-type ribon-helix-helix transcriptional regulator
MVRTFENVSEGQREASQQILGVIEEETDNLQALDPEDPEQQDLAESVVLIREALEEGDWATAWHYAEDALPGLNGLGLNPDRHDVQLNWSEDGF